MCVKDVSSLSWYHLSNTYILYILCSSSNCLASTASSSSHTPFLIDLSIPPTIPAHLAPINDAFGHWRWRCRLAIGSSSRIASRVPRVSVTAALSTCRVAQLSRVRQTLSLSVSLSLFHCVCMSLSGGQRLLRTHNGITIACDSRPAFQNLVRFDLTLFVFYFISIVSACLWKFDWLIHTNKVN